MRPVCLALCLVLTLAVSVEAASGALDPSQPAAATAKKKCKRGYTRNKRGRCVKKKATNSQSKSLTDTARPVPTTDATAVFTQLLTGAKLYRVAATTGTPIRATGLPIPTPGLPTPAPPTPTPGSPIPTLSNEGYFFCAGGKLAYHAEFIGGLSGVSIAAWQGTWKVASAVTQGDLVAGIVNYTTNSTTTPPGPSGTIEIDLYRSTQQAFIGPAPGQGIEFQRLPGLGVGC